MKKRLCIVWIALCAALLSCATTGSGGTAPAPHTVMPDTETVFEGDGLSLAEAIEQSAEKIAADLPAGSRVAIVAFDSEHDNLSGYIMDELGGALAESELEVAERRNLPVIYQELNFQMSGEVSDETAVSVGKFLAVEYVLTGQLIKAGDRYRYRLSGINVETAALEGSVRLDVRNSRAMNSLIADLRNAKISAAAAYKPPAALPGTAGAFLDRGILFATRSDFDLAIEDFTEAIRLAPNMAAAYLQRSKALHASVSTVSDLDENFDYITTGTGYSEKTKDVYNRALEDASAAIKLSPALASAYRNRGRLHNDMGEHDKAIGDYNQAIRLDPNYVLAYNGRGVTYADKKDYDRAIADYTQAIKIDPNFALGYSNRGNAYYNKGDYDRAIADCTQAIRLDAKYTTNLAYYYNARGVEYHNNKKDYDRAIADYNQAIRLDPNEALYTKNLAIAYNNRGDAYYNNKDYDRAIEDYERAVRLAPNEALYTRNLAVAYNNRGLAYYNNKSYDRAIGDYTKAINLGSSASRYTSRGLAYYDNNDYVRAIADYNQAIKIDPNYTLAYSNRGLAYYNNKDYDRAIGDYTKAINLEPSASRYTNRGLAYYNNKDYDSAIADYNQAIRIDPDYTPAYNGRGLAYYNKEDYDRAIADYNQAIRLNPNEAMYARNLAIAYTSRGNAYWGKKYYARARGDYEQALRFDPNNTAARNNLEKLRNMGY